MHRSSGDAVSAPPIQWYPGHIAKAEQQLKRNLEKVDLVIEVRDARTLKEARNGLLWRCCSYWSSI